MNRIDAPIDPMQSSRLRTQLDRAWGQAQVGQLMKADELSLPSRDSGDLPIMPWVDGAFAKYGFAF